MTLLRPQHGWNPSITFFTAVLFSLITLSTAHQSIAYPYPISFDLACRVGLGRNCGGPCPTHNLRKDQSPNNPSVTVRRGELLPLHILKNNHVGGFTRWSLVKLGDMQNKKKHAEGSFLYTCADLEVTHCTRENQERDCKVDRMNQFYKHYLRIPKVYPDGVYVLGWIWYGGAVSTGTHGAFGDYHDCVYIRIKGGAFEDSYQPTFKAGDTMTGRDGLCLATTNRVGHCFREPCPFGNRATTLMKPAEFEGKHPVKILRRSFEDAYRIGTKTATEPTAKPTIKPKIKPLKVSSQPQPKQRNSGASSATGAAGKEKVRNGKNTQTTAPQIKPVGTDSSLVQFRGSVANASGNNEEKPENSSMKDKKQMPSSQPSIPAEPTSNPQPRAQHTNHASKKQRKEEKRLRKQAKLKERKEKKIGKAKAKKAKLEDKRIRRKRVKEEKAVKKQLRQREKQRKKQERRAKKQAKRRASKAKRSGKRSFAIVPSDTKGIGYDDCFEEGIFPVDDGHIDYGDKPPLRN